MSNYDVLKIANILSNNQSTTLNKNLISNVCNTFYSDEIATGVDRSRSSIGMSLQLNYPSLFINPDSPGFDIELINRSILELGVHLLKPQKVLCGTVDFACAATLNELVANCDFVNTLSVHYLESFINQTIEDSRVISFQDIENDNFASDYDMAVIALELFSHDTSLIDTIWDHILPSGCMIMSGFSDFGTLYTQKDMHPFYEYLEKLCSDSDKCVIHIPVGTSIMYVIKL